MARTVGVEEEFILVDLRSGRPLAVSPAVLAKATTSLGQDPLATVGVVPRGAIEGEFQQQQLEIHTSPVANLVDLDAELRQWRGVATDLAREVGASVAALGTSPLPVEPRSVPSPRYARIRELLALTARHHLTCGCHVHVSVESDEVGVAVIDRVRVWVPVLLAMTANSPFYQGEDSGYVSYRSQALSLWPSFGPPELFGSAEAYHRLLDAMIATGALLDEGMNYWDMRLAVRYPTVEIRVADVCLDVADTVVLAALCRALVETAVEQWRRGEPAPEVPVTMLRLASWRAARYGVESDLVDPRTMQLAPARDVVPALVTHVATALDAGGDRAVVEAGLERLWTQGNGADRQRRTMERTGQLVDVVADAVRLTAGKDSD
jgi:carboxylate-amine ligase